MKKTSIITITNQKGGVGKTTTVCNLAAVYAAMGKRVLVIDLDHQCNATMLFDVEDEARESGKNISRAFDDDLTLSQVVIKSPLDCIDVVAGDRGLEEMKEKWNSHPKRFKLLEVFLKDRRLSQYEVVLIDTHPSYDCYLQSALVCSHHYLIPMFAEEFSIRGLGQMIGSVEAIGKYHNEALNFLGCVITKFDKNSRTHVDFENEIRNVAKANRFRVFNQTIPYSKAVAGAEASHLPLTVYKPDLPISLAYSVLAKEIWPHLKSRKATSSRKKSFSPIIFNRSVGFEAGVDL